MVHTFDPHAQKAEVGGSLWVRGQPGLHRELEGSLGYVEGSYLENKRLQIALPATQPPDQGWGKTKIKREECVTWINERW